MREHVKVSQNAFPHTNICIYYALYYENRNRNGNGNEMVDRWRFL